MPGFPCSQSHKYVGPEGPRSSVYLNQFLRLRCAPDLLEAKLFPNAKEITETMAAAEAVHDHLGTWFPPDDSSVHCFVVGDGVVPRTGATFALRTKWDVTSVDPQLYERDYPFRRLDLIRRNIEDVSGFDCEKALLVLVHSHAYPPSCIRAIRATAVLAVVAIPCCVPTEQLAGKSPDLEYEDGGIWAEKRVVKIWKNILAD